MGVQGVFASLFLKEFPLSNSPNTWVYRAYLHLGVGVELLVVAGGIGEC